MIKYNFNAWLGDFFSQYLPTKRDNIKQIALKLLFLILIIAIVAGGTYFGSYYFEISAQERVLTDTREIFYSDKLVADSRLKQKNSDYKAWLKFGETQLDNPVFQGEDNRFYLNHNANKEKGSYGSLFFDYRTKLTDKNKVIYGNTVSNGAMFSALQKLRSLGFYNQNSVLSFTCNGIETEYKVFAVFVLNAAKKDDDGRIFDIYRNEFNERESFENWIADAKKRSVIESNVDVGLQDDILTLVTSCEDFPNARFVVMARSEREQEIVSSDFPVAHASEQPQYPKKWYDVRDIEYPFENFG